MNHVQNSRMLRIRERRVLILRKPVVDECEMIKPVFVYYSTVCIYRNVCYEILRRGKDTDLGFFTNGLLDSSASVRLRRSVKKRTIHIEHPKSN